MTAFDLRTPCLLLDHARLIANAERMRARAASLGVRLRPHVKTVKSIAVVRAAFPDPTTPLTVSTLREAEYFAAHGYRDVLYAVGIAPAKLGAVSALIRDGVRIAIVLDDLVAARAVAEAGVEHGVRFEAFVEIDVDGQRGGVAADSPELVRIATCLATGRGAALRGLMTYANSAYRPGPPKGRARSAAMQLDAARVATGTLAAAGIGVPEVSVGSTPTACAASSLAGATELRAGVFLFNDLTIASLGACGIDDCALSVLATVVGRADSRGELIIDAGWTALSTDAGNVVAGAPPEFGLVCDADGVPMQDLVVRRLSQEHGVVARRDGGALPPGIGIGTQLRVLPNHACATAACHAHYHVLGAGPQILRWERIAGW